MENGQRVAVTGSAGYIGAPLTQTCSGLGWAVLRLVHRLDGSGSGTAVVADVTRFVEPGVLAGVDTVFHLAGKAHALAEMRQDESEYFRVNTTGTQNVLEAARRAGVRRFVFFSSVKAMSRMDRSVAFDTVGQIRPWNECDEVEPDTPYGKSKLEAERLVLAGGFVPEPVVLRLAMVYGPNAKGNLRRMIEATSRGRFLPLPNTGNQRSMVHVDDVVEAALLAARHPRAPGQTFIVTDGRGYATREICDMISLALGRRPVRFAVPLCVLRVLGRGGDLIGRTRGRRFFFDSDALHKLLESAWFSCEKIQNVLGFRPKWNLETALADMVQEVSRALVTNRRPAGTSVNLR